MTIALWNPVSTRRTITACCAVLSLMAPAFNAAPAAADLHRTISQAQKKIVKLYGAGGLRGLEAWQTGLLISEDGFILTVWSYVLDADRITAVLDDGRRFDARLVGADPSLEVAVLKIDGEELPSFDLAKAATVGPGTRVVALSNVFGVAQGNEPATAQAGVVTAVTQLAARRGIFETPYRGPVYVVDAVTNNPGAAGGAIINYRGQLVAMIGKELKNSLNNTWLNYAVPISELRKSVDEIRAGKFVTRQPSETEKKPNHAHTIADLGVLLLPDVLERTPPFVDQVQDRSPAARAGVQPDDLIVLVGDRLIQSIKNLHAELEYIDHEDPVKLTVIRGHELVEIVIASGDRIKP